jgi:hypothetical protein
MITCISNIIKKGDLTNLLASLFPIVHDPPGVPVVATNIDGIATSFYQRGKSVQKLPQITIKKSWAYDKLIF